MTTEIPTRGRERHRARQQLVAERAGRQGMVLSRRQLRELGIDRFAVRNEITAGRWQVLGEEAVAVGPVTAHGRLWGAVFEAGPSSALDGTAALVAAGLRGFDPRWIDVSLVRGSWVREVQGVRSHTPRHRGPVDHLPDGLPVVRLPVAAARAAEWSVSAKEAATVLAMTVQQRIITPEELGRAWNHRRKGRRRRFLDTIVRDITDGAQALSELRFSADCRGRGLPEPTRQRIRRLPNGVAHLDAEFEPYGCGAEIDGCHHFEVTQAAADLIRQNEVVLDGTAVLRISVVDYHLHREAFLDQVERCLVARGWRRGV